MTKANTTTKVEKSNYEVATEMVFKAIKTGTKIVGNEISTGTSFFQGKRRLCKVMKGKRGLTLEINVNLPEEVEKEYSLEIISPAVAKAKHLGTMKYRARLVDMKLLNKLVKAMVDSFKEESKAIELAAAK